MTLNTLISPLEKKTGLSQTYLLWNAFYFLKSSGEYYWGLHGRGDMEGWEVFSSPN